MTRHGTFVAAPAEHHGRALQLRVSEPRCRICRDPETRRTVNHLLDRRQALLTVRDVCEVVGQEVSAPGLTYRAILGHLEPLNALRPERDQITYDSLWVHAQRHHDWRGVVAYWCARLDRELGERLRRMRQT
ncbi:hypothetical protein [Mycolicibacterium duvalii]|uniref:hypothetical protein n=1 Tax=Mycolicibacterium duvalii TaxID=39688 RepID=UPI0010542050|nr:hypothetical protein [Mycolicibacterium duvalii]MCV7366651.1 hypothetical protein [Mycolicibacterium duvalii]